VPPPREEIEMRAVVLNGMPAGKTRSHVETATLRQLEASGYDTREFVLRELDIAPCTGCFGCWTKTPGICVRHDDALPIAETVAGADVIVMVTPVTFGGYSSDLKKVLDRMIGLILPFFGRYGGEIHHRPRYERNPALVAIGVLDEADAEAKRVFATLVERHARNMHAPFRAAMVLPASAATTGSVGSARGTSSGDPTDKMVAARNR